MKKITSALFILLIIVFSQTSFAQNSRPDPVSAASGTAFPRNSVDLRISFWNNSRSDVSVGLTGVSIDAGTGGISGRIMYNYYYNENFALYIGAGAMESKVKIRTLSNYTSTLVPIMMGLKYFFTGASGDGFLRPYLSGSTGILIGTESAVTVLSIGSHSETAMGLYAGIGSDFILGSLIKLQADIGFNLFTDFQNNIGSRKNYSGPEFAVGIGIMF